MIRLSLLPTDAWKSRGMKSQKIPEKHAIHITLPSFVLKRPLMWALKARDKEKSGVRNSLEIGGKAGNVLLIARETALRKHDVEHTPPLKILHQKASLY